MLTYDYSDLFVGDGAIADAWEAERAKLPAALDALRGLRAQHPPTFLACPDATLGAVEERANANNQWARAIVLGIGGSSLGAKAVYHALTRPVSRRWRDGRPRAGADLHFVENVDPVETSDVFEMLLDADAGVVVVTKSGGTVETMGTFFAAREVMTALGTYPRQVVAITDPDAGMLRSLCGTDGIASLPVPPGVGGRFSVFTPVGLFPLALAGVDLGAFLRGAARARDAAFAESVDANPAAAFALAQVAAYRCGYDDVVMMPYASGLRAFADWFVQLWAESLGKTAPSGANVGPTPIVAVGATDQHSQLQLFVEGPATKNLVFVELAEEPVDLRVGTTPPGCEPLAHLSGRSLADVRGAELRGVRAALAEAKRPTSTFKLSSLCADSLGELMMTLACATGIAGSLLGVNPYDQPGVELAKRFAHGLLGREDEAAFAARYQAFKASRAPRTSAATPE